MSSEGQLSVPSPLWIWGEGYSEAYEIRDSWEVCFGKMQAGNQVEHLIPQGRKADSDDDNDNDKMMGC